MRIRHQTQLGWSKPNLCGQACAAMALSALLGRDITPLQVATETGNADGSFTDFAELAGMFKHYGHSVTYQRPASFDWWRALIADGGIGIALVDHASYPGGAAYPYAHFIVVAGMTDTHVVTFNPLRRTGPTEITHAEFRRCIWTPSRYVGGVNMPLQGVRVNGWVNAAPDPNAALIIVRDRLATIRDRTIAMQEAA